MSPLPRRKGSVPTKDGHISYPGKGLDLSNNPFSARRHLKSWTCTRETWADLLLRVGSRRSSSSSFLFPVTDAVCLHRGCTTVAVFYPGTALCCKNWKYYLSPSFRTKELIKLHIFRKSCLKYSQDQSPLSWHKLHPFLHHTDTNNVQDERLLHTYLCYT